MMQRQPGDHVQMRYLEGEHGDPLALQLGRLRLAHRAASLGSVATLIGPPAVTSHVEVPPAERAAAGIPETLIRYDVGLGGPPPRVAAGPPPRGPPAPGPPHHAGVDYVHESGTSIYFRDPDGARLELIADPLGEMYGSRVL
jgi:hypothetical protein